MPSFGEKGGFEKGERGGWDLVHDVHGILGLAIASSASHRGHQVETLRVAWQDQVQRLSSTHSL